MSTQLILLLAFFCGLLVSFPGTLNSITESKEVSLDLSGAKGWSLLTMFVVGLLGWIALLYFSDPVQLAEDGHSRWRIFSAGGAGVVLALVAVHERFKLFKNNWGRWLLWAMVVVNVLMVCNWVLYGPEAFYFSE